MKNTFAKVMTASLLSFTAFSFAHAADENASKAEVKKQIQVCAKKKQGDWVTYANKGVTYNGACEKNESGKLQFSFPAPAGGAAATASAAPADEAIAHKPAVEPATTETPAPAAVPEAPAAPDAPQANDTPAQAQPADASQ